jgi:hypothetical protein
MTDEYGVRQFLLFHHTGDVEDVSVERDLGSQPM